MALGALISAYQEASGGSGELAATLPLAGRTLVEYQARLAQAAGASPVVLLVERMPASLIAAVDRLTGEGVAVQLAAVRAKRRIISRPTIRCWFSPTGCSPMRPAWTGSHRPADPPC
jgi:hypothetical protein